MRGKVSKQGYHKLSNLFKHEFKFNFNAHKNFRLDNLIIGDTIQVYGRLVKMLYSKFIYFCYFKFLLMIV